MQDDKQWIAWYRSDECDVPQFESNESPGVDSKAGHENFTIEEICHSQKMSRRAASMADRPRPEFKSVLEKAYDCCRKNRDKPWILEPIDDFVGSFNGILFARKDTPIPGCAFKFTLIIEESMLAEPPRVIFEKPLQHPLILGRVFCFPVGSGSMSLACRTTSLTDIMDQLVVYFFDPRKFKATEVINQDVRNSLKGEISLRKFWDSMRVHGCLEDPEAKE